MGKADDATHRICISGMLLFHFSVIVSLMNSGHIRDNPNMHGKETNAVRRNSFLNTIDRSRLVFCIDWLNIGWAIPLIVPVRTWYPMKVHLFAWL